jgi:acetyl esterase/lipase
MPQNSKNKQLPVIIWTHGGAWLSGDKSDDAPYFKLLAQKGYAVIAPNYSLAPGHTYPTPIHQLNDAYGYIKSHTKALGADTNKIILAGDSAGAQLSAQMAAIITSPSYAKEVGVVPNLQPTQLKGVVLNCGIYMMERLAEPTKDLSKLIRWGDDVTVWAYSGTQDFTDPVIRKMSPYYHVTGDFPPTYISGGNGDLLTDTQSKPLADKLQVLGVSVDRLFYAENHKPALSHEYQFQLDKKDAQSALQKTLSFIEKQTK